MKVFGFGKTRLILLRLKYSMETNTRKQLCSHFKVAIIPQSAVRFQCERTVKDILKRGILTLPGN
ncbi:hypothetical protein WN48_02737 [Eufriesea mexicana]|uniref:Uncharacterized protein n=1 Tax=Eufriesea mexicana TaxID=516756 RepID=A0A310SFR6_9HYME|nr:hypothetical protein WN48_02737 [Eufriesea mexicana]